MKSLLLLRHAKSNWDDSGIPDHDRPLKKRGRKAAQRMGRLLKEIDLIPQFVLCSTAVRARETLRLVLKSSWFLPAVEHMESLYHCLPETFISVLSQLDEPHDRVMVVGHNPGLEQFLEQLTGIGPSTHSFPTAALAEIEIQLDFWKNFDESTRGRLVRFWRPKELDAD